MSLELPAVALKHTSQSGVVGYKELQVNKEKGGLLTAKLEMAFWFRKYPLPPDQSLSPFDRILKGDLIAHSIHSTSI